MTSPEISQSLPTIDQPNHTVRRLAEEIRTAMSHAANYVPQKKDLNRPILFWPGTFDQMKDAQREYQRFLLHTLRRPDIAARYEQVRNERKADSSYNQAEFIKSEIMKGEPIAFVENDYPIDVPCDHFTLWYETSITPEELAEFLATEFDKRNIGGSGRRYILKENPEHIKSMPEVSHLHTFVEPKNSPRSDCALLFDFP